MNQEEELIFSFAKIKRISLKYWYIVVITFLLGVAFVGVTSYNAVTTSKNAAASNNQSTDTETDDKIDTAANTDTTADKKLSPTGTTYFNITRYIKIDWSELYPDVTISDDNSAEDNYYILTRINNQNNYEKEILADCANIASFQTFKNDINTALKAGNFTPLTDTDSISYSVSGNDIVVFNVYSQCSTKRIQCILDAAVDSYISHGTDLFKLGKCSTIVTNDVMACEKGKDGKFTPLYMTASEWLEAELEKGASSVITADAVTADSTASTANVTFKSALMTKKNIVLLLGSIILGFGILFVIAVFDHVLDIPEEALFIGLDKLGEVSLKDARTVEKTAGHNKKCSSSDAAYLLSSRTFLERLTTIAGNNDYHKIALITMQSDPMIDTICGQSGASSAKSDLTGSLEIKKYEYPYQYLDNISNIHDCDAAIIAVHGGCDKKTVLRQCVENASIDSSKILGFVWIAQ